MAIKLKRSQILKLTSEEFENMTENDIDEMAIPSYRHKNPIIRWLMWRRYECIAKLSKFSGDMAVMEFGCGIGLFLPELNNSCGKVYAIDLFPYYAKLLCKRMNLDVQFLSDVIELPDNHLSIIIAADVLEHLDDLNEYLTLFREKLGKKGRLIISGPTENIIYKIGRIIAGFGDKGDYHHRNIDQIIKTIEEEGFNQNKTITLPFRIPPFLFKVCEFVIKDK